MIDDQRAYLAALHAEVKPLVKRKLSLEQIRAKVDAMRERVLKNDQSKRYVGKRFGEQIEKIYGDYTGQILGRLDITK